MSVTAPNYMKLFAAQREEALAGSVISYTVPITAGLPLEIHAEFQTLDLDTVITAQKKIEKAKPGTEAAIMLVVHSGILAKACRRIWMQTENGTQLPMRVDLEANPEGYTRFDTDAAEFLGLPDPKNSSAAQVIKAIFVHDFHIVGASALIMKRSGAAEQEADEATAGK